MQEFLSPAELAKQLGLPLSTIWKWCREGLPHVKIGRHIRVRRTEFDEWWEENKKNGRKAS